jgi:hypothetical protein
MTEYLILTLERALPLVWEYQKQISSSVNVGPYNVGAGLPNSRHKIDFSGSGSVINFNTTDHRIFSSFKTPALSDLPSLPSGIAGRLKPRLYNARITPSSVSGSPTNILELWLADPTTKLPSQRINRIDNSTGTYKERIFSQTDPVQGIELEWDTWYSIVFIITSADSSNYWQIALYNNYSPSNWNTTTKVGYSTNGGQTWTTYDNYLWKGNVYAQHFFYLQPVKDELYRSSKAVNYYYSPSSTLPSNVYLTSLLIINNDVIPVGENNPIPDRVEGKYDVSPVIYTSASISSAFQFTLTINKTAKYDKNPVEIDMFNIVEAYITRIDFLDTSVTNAVRLNKNFEQEFSGSGGTALTFDPPLLFWSAEVLSGRVKITAVCFE